MTCNWILINWLDFFFREVIIYKFMIVMQHNNYFYVFITGNEIIMSYKWFSWVETKMREFFAEWIKNKINMKISDNKCSYICIQIIYVSNYK